MRDADARGGPRHELILPALDLLLTGYFHEDCEEDYGDERGVVTAFMRMEPELAPLLVDEVDAVLRKFPDDPDLADFILAFKSPWGPARSDSRNWLTAVRAYAVESTRSGGSSMTEPSFPTPALKHLSGAYFHQDWMLLEEDEWAVLKDFLDHEPRLAPQLSGEIDSVLAELQSDDEVRDYLFALGSCFTATAEDGGYRGWLAEVGRRSRSAASTS